MEHFRRQPGIPAALELKKIELIRKVSANPFFPVVVSSTTTEGGPGKLCCCFVAAAAVAAVVVGVVAMR